MATGQPVALILSEAIQEIKARSDSLEHTAAGAEEALKRITDEQRDAAKALVGLQKLHRMATVNTRKSEQRALDRAKGRQANRPTDIIADCLGKTLDLLSKPEIRERTGLDAGTVGVVISKGLKSGVFIEENGRYGVAQALSRELSAPGVLAVVA